MCADHGAEVVKLELPDGSDALRALQPVKDGVPLWWKIANRGKRGITLDVRQPRGRELFLEMLPSFDVLVENFRTGTMDRWGLDIETLHRVNPRLVVVRLTGFGQTGPYRGRPGFARIFEAMSGFTSLTGEAGGSPLHSNFPVGDAVAGLFGAFSIAAEVARLRGDPDAKGVEVDLVGDRGAVPPARPAAGRARAARARCARRPATARATPRRRTCTAARTASTSRWSRRPTSSSRACARRSAAPSGPTTRASATNPARVVHLAELDAGLSAWFAGRAYDPIAEALEAAGVPFSKVYTIADIEQDPHYLARQAIVRLPDPDYGSLPAPCIVPRIVGREMPIPRTGPSVGEHNAEVYAEFGIDAARLASLRAERVV